MKSITVSYYTKSFNAAIIVGTNKYK